METFEGKLIHRPSGEDASVLVTVHSRQNTAGVARIVWEAELALPDGTHRHVERRDTSAPAAYARVPVDDLARWLLVGELQA